jgi:hypothetical protein
MGRPPKRMDCQLSWDGGLRLVGEDPNKLLRTIRQHRLDKRFHAFVGGGRSRGFGSCEPEEEWVMGLGSLPVSFEASSGTTRTHRAHALLESLSSFL